MLNVHIAIDQLYSIYFQIAPKFEMKIGSKCRKMEKERYLCSGCKSMRYAQKVSFILTSSLAFVSASFLVFTSSLHFHSYALRCDLSRRKTLQCYKSAPALGNRSTERTSDRIKHRSLEIPIFGYVACGETANIESDCARCRVIGVALPDYPLGEFVFAKY